MPSTSTDFTRLPISSRSRSRRTTSTSGSSGIGLPDRARRERVRIRAELVVEAAPCDLCRGLLRLLLRTSFALAVRVAAQRHRGEEALQVVGTLGAHLVARQLVEATRRELLQARLKVVTAGTGRTLAD